MSCFKCSRPPVWRLATGFTLVELLVVIGIIGLLVSILLPAMSQVRKFAQEVSCRSNLRQIGACLQMYCNSYGGWAPRGNSLFEELDNSHILQNVLQYVSTDHPEGAGGYNPPNPPAKSLILGCPSLQWRPLAYSPVPITRNWSYTVNTRTFGNDPSDPNPFKYRRKLGGITQSTLRCWLADAPASDPCWQTYDNGNMCISYNRHRNGSNVLYVDGHVNYFNPDKELIWGNPRSIFDTDLVFYGNNTN